MNGEVKRQTIWIMLRDDLHCLLFYLFQFNNLWASPIWGRIFLLLCDLDWKFLLDYRGNKSTCTTARRQRQKKEWILTHCSSRLVVMHFPHAGEKGNGKCCPSFFFTVGSNFAHLEPRNSSRALRWRLYPIAPLYPFSVKCLIGLETWLALC